MHINGIQTRLLSFLLLIQFIVVQRYPFGLALLSHMRPNKGMLKGWLNGTHVHHSMKACMLNKGMLKGAQRYTCTPNMKTCTCTPNMKTCTCIQGTPHFPPQRNKEFYDMGKGRALEDGLGVA